jgi:hypothetical protein
MLKIQANFHPVHFAYGAELESFLYSVIGLWIRQFENCH